MAHDGGAHSARRRSGRLRAEGASASLAGALAEAGAGRRAPASDGVGGPGPPSPRSGFGEVTPKPDAIGARAEADGAKPPGLA